MIISPDKILLRAFRKEKGAIPFWFMRQAGRYLPEYRELRTRAKNFLDFCYTPEMAAEATLQPIRRFGMSAAILFSDILVIPDSLGVHVRFEEGKGPLLEPVKTQGGLDALAVRPGRLEPVYEALRLTKKQLPPQTALIGFAGAPWTLACYMVEGRGSRDFQAVRSLALTDRGFFTRLITVLSDAVAAHAIRQIEAGADVIQLFDSWAGVLSEQEFSDWVIEPTARIACKIKAACPDVPVIGFPRQAGCKYADYARHTGVDALSIDSSVPLAWAAEVLQPLTIVQGNLDPLLLAQDGEAALAQARRIISALGDKSFVFNLGHGILPHTPLGHVESLCNLIKSL